MLVMGVQGGRVRVVVEYDRKPEADLKCVPDVETAPFCRGKVGRALGTDHALGSYWPGRVEPDGTDCVARDPGPVQHVSQRPGKRLDSLVGPVADTTRRLGHLRYEKAARRVKHSCVDRRAAAVKAGHDPPVRIQHQLASCASAAI